MTLKVAKFGGSSLAAASQIARVRQIVADDPQRRYVVPSAPGKRHVDDQKITDMLYLCHEHARQGLPFGEVFALVAERYRNICTELGLALDMQRHLDEAAAGIEHHAHYGGRPDFAASRGEYLNGLILAEVLDCPFIDAAELIRFNARGRLDQETTYRTVADRLARVERAVIPGFYGRGHDGEIRTFSRGGSDVTGAVIARGVSASLYENWTDVAGLLMADPNIVDHPSIIDRITYRELRELAYMGATVLHDEAIFPVRDAGIPVNIRNTNEPDDPGTMIVPEAAPVAHTRTITGIAGQRDFTVIAIEKALMNAEVGFARRVLSVLERHDVSIEHMPSGIDTLSVVVSDGQLDGKLEDLMHALRAEVQPDALEVYPDMALIATVGRGMAYTPGMAGRLFMALGSTGVNVRMIDQGSSELNIIVGVAAADFEHAVRAIYDAFVHDTPATSAAPATP
ncbi:MAG: aspartate kinase [Phycisphaeraceae bacterium]